jgi:hypothetical protein
MVTLPALCTTNTHSGPATILTKSAPRPMILRSRPVPLRKVRSPSEVAITTFPNPWRSPSELFLKADEDNDNPPEAMPRTQGGVEEEGDIRE